jgi:hypothetical protein
MARLDGLVSRVKRKFCRLKFNSILGKLQSIASYILKVENALKPNIRMIKMAIGTA